MSACKVLGIQGSPCLDGTTARLLDAALEGARAEGAFVERIDLASVRLEPCRACEECSPGTGCVQTGDIMDRLYKEIRQVDGIALASPIFFMGVTAQTKAMIDRCQCFWIEKNVSKVDVYEGKRRPKGLFLSCAGSSKPGMFEPSLHVVRSFFAAIDYEYIGEVLLSHTDDPKLEARMPAALESARAAGRKLCL